MTARTSSFLSCISLALTLALHFAVIGAFISANGGEPYDNMWEGLDGIWEIIAICAGAFSAPALIVAPMVTDRDSESATAQRWKYITALLWALPFTLLWSVFLWLYTTRSGDVQILGGKPALVFSGYVLVGAWALWIVPAAIVLRGVLKARRSETAVAVV